MRQVVAAEGWAQVHMPSSARTVALLVWAGAVLLVLGLNIVAPVPGLEDGWPWVGGLMGFPVAAVIVLINRPGQRVGHLLALISSAAFAQFTLGWIAATWPAAPAAPYLDVFAVVASIGIFGGILGLLHLFPDGVAVSRAHRRFLQLLAAGLFLAGSLTLVNPARLESTGGPNPMGVGPHWLTPIIDGMIVILPLGAMLAVPVLIMRARRATPIVQAQLRWFFAGAAAVTAMFGAFAAWDEQAGPLLSALLSVLFLVGFWSLPAAIVVAITRYRLYDIDRILSRTVSYVIVAGVIAGVYALSVLGLQALLPVGGSQVAVAGSTLAAAALFSPVRRVIHERIDRRFDRARYEARVVATEFGRRLQRELDPEVISTDLSRVIHSTMHPVGVTVWLRR